jgi:hypothetical protein
MIELLVLSFGLACFLPEFIRASDDVNFGWLFHFLASFTNPPDAGGIRAGLEFELPEGCRS